MKTKLLAALALGVALVVGVTMEVKTTIVFPRPAPTVDPAQVEAAQQAATIRSLKTLLASPAP